MSVGDDFPSWLKRQLHRREWSAAELARRMGVSPARVSEWLAGKYLPNPASCLRLADALNVEPDDVLARAGHREPTEPLAPDDSRSRIIALVKRVQMTPQQADGLEAMLMAWLESPIAAEIDGAPDET
ncbi:MAG TPA: helix-turn-helix transcriptional regulator [Thermomicrobiales bacterium]|nr:helix-turn-helix transcriptional regulator [Thermomicrobiales bacterium]